MSLLCCPFCGGEPTKEEQMDEDIWSHNTVPWRRVGCNQCEIWTNWTCEGFDPSETEAWNRRPALATPSPGKADAEAIKEEWFAGSNVWGKDSKDWLEFIQIYGYAPKQLAEWLRAVI